MDKILMGVWTGRTDMDKILMGVWTGRTDMDKIVMEFRSCKQYSKHFDAFFL